MSTRIRAAGVLAMLALFPAACKSHPQIQAMGINLKLQQKSLANGLKIIIVEDHTVPIVTYQTWFRVGSVDETPGKTGISHLFEHLMFKGTPKYGPKQFFLQLEAKGAEVNAFTTRDYTVYFENFVPELLEKVIDMESDRMDNLRLDQPTLDAERAVVLEERKLRTENSPDGRMQEALWQLAFTRHPYRWPIIGYPRDLFSITLAELIEYFNGHYQPANATVVIVGDVDPAKTFELVKKYYDRIAANPRPVRNIPNEPEQKEERRLVMRDQVASEKLAQAYHCSAASNDDSYALDVLANILFEGTSSRGYRRLVEEKDLMLGIAGSAYTPTFPGLFIISGTMKQGISAEKAEVELDRLIREVQETDVTEEEIRVAVKQLTVQVVDSVRTPHGMGQLIGTVQTILGDPERFSEDLAKYLKVNAADVRRVAQKYLTPNSRAVVTMKPGKTG